MQGSVLVWPSVPPTCTQRRRTDFNFLNFRPPTRQDSAITREKLQHVHQGTSFFLVKIERKKEEKNVTRGPLLSELPINLADQPKPSEVED